MAQSEPKVGQFYSCPEQSKMHGGNPRLTLPTREDKVTLIRFRLHKNPGGPHIIDHGPPKARVAGCLTESRCFVDRANRYLSTGTLGALPGST